METVILLDSALWISWLDAIISERLGVAVAAASLLAGVICGQCMPRIGVKEGLLVGTLAGIPITLICYWFPAFGYEERSEVLFLVLAVTVIYFICRKWNTSKQ